MPAPSSATKTGWFNSALAATTNYNLTGAGTTCTSTSSVASGATCGLGIIFAPTSIGSLAGTVNLSDNSIITTQSISLSGTGTQASQSITFTPASPIFYTATPITLTATGGGSGNPVTFSILSGPGTLSGTNNATLTLTGPGAIQIAANQAGSTNYLAAPQVTHGIVVTAASSYTVPTTAVATTSSTQTAFVTITTAGTLGTISVLTQGATGLDFNFVSGGTCSTGTAYTVSQTCSVFYTFTPTHPGQRLGGITLTTSGNALLGNIFLTGTGTGPQISYSPGVKSIIGSGWGNAAGVTVDASGNVYIADQTHKQVWKETLSGGSYTASIVADSTSNYGLNAPTDVAVDGAGNVYIADQGNGRIVKETLSGGTYTQSLVVSVGAYALTVDGSGNVYLPNGANVLMETLQTNGSYVQSTIGSGMNIGYGSVKVDGSGNLYIGNQYQQQVVKETLSGGSYTASVIANGFQWGVGIALDAAGDVFVIDAGTGNLYKETPSGSSYSQSTLATGYNGPIFLSSDGSGNLYVSNNGAEQFVKLDLSDAPTLTYASTNTGSASTVQSVQITNNGNAALTAASTGLAVSSYYTQVAGSGTPADCTTTFSLASGASCNISLEFVPVSPASGTTTGTTVLTDNNLNVSSATQTINLSGSAVSLTPAVTSISPTSGINTGGTTVTITGTNLGSATAVKFGTTSATINTNTATSITATSPTGTAGTVDITVTTSGGTSATSTADQFTYLTGQTISFTQPTTPAAMGVGTIMLTATGGASGNAVTFTIDGSSTATGTIVGNTLTTTGVGNLVIDANQAGNSSYTAAVQVQKTIIVVQASYVVDSATDPASGTAAHCALGHTAGTCTLRDAVTAANALSGTLTANVTFSSTVFPAAGNTTITLGSVLAITSSVNITGNGATSTILDGGSAVELMTFTGSGTATLTGLAMNHGKTTTVNGGAINAQNGTLNITGSPRFYRTRDTGALADR